MSDPDCWLLLNSISNIMFSRYLGHNLTFHGHVTSSVTWPFEAVSYWWSFEKRLTNGVSTLQPFLEILASKLILGSRVWPFRVTWRNQSRNHLISHRSFPIGGPLDGLLVTVVIYNSNKKPSCRYDSRRCNRLKDFQKSCGHRRNS